MHSVRERSIELLPGQYFDQETNTQNIYFRDYDPAIGRYIQADPLGITMSRTPTPGAEINHLYSYVGSNPLSRIDPTGQGWEQIIIPVVGVSRILCVSRCREGRSTAVRVMGLGIIRCRRLVRVIPPFSHRRIKRCRRKPAE